MSYDELLDGHYIIAGTPDEVIDRSPTCRRRAADRHLRSRRRSRGWITHDMRSIELMGAKVYRHGDGFERMLHRPPGTRHPSDRPKP